MLKNSVQSYGMIALVLHWFFAVVVIGLFVLGQYMTGLSYYDPWYKAAPYIHKGIGVCLFLLLLARVGWRWLNPVPAPLSGTPLWQQRAALAVHRALYVLLFALPLSGYLISTADGRPLDVFGWFEIPALIRSVENLEDYAGAVHEVLALALMGLVGVHALGALKHHFIDRDETLWRMLRVQRSSRTNP